VPLSTARGWPSSSHGTLMLTLIEMSTGTETVDAATMPPGALGRRVELATLTVHAY